MNSEDKDFTQRGYLKLTMAQDQCISVVHKRTLQVTDVDVSDRVHLNLTFDPYNWIQGHCIPSILNH